MFNSKKIAPVSLFLNLFKSEPSQTGLFYPDLCYLYLFENVCIDIHQFLIDYLGKNNRVLYVDIEIIVQIYFPTSKTCYIWKTININIYTFTTMLRISVLNKRNKIHHKSFLSWLFRCSPNLLKWRSYIFELSITFVFSCSIFSFTRRVVDEGLPLSFLFTGRGIVSSPFSLISLSWMFL